MPPILRAEIVVDEKQNECQIISAPEWLNKNPETCVVERSVRRIIRRLIPRQQRDPILVQSIQWLHYEDQDGILALRAYHQVVECDPHLGWVTILPTHTPYYYTQDNQ